MVFLFKGMVDMWLIFESFHDYVCSFARAMLVLGWCKSGKSKVGAGLVQKVLEERCRG